MMAVILAGGKGTRLRPFTMTIPKPLLPLGDVPIVEVVIRQLVACGIGRVVLTLGHMAPLFTAFFGDGGRFGARIDYCLEDEPLGTAGPLRLVQDLEPTFLVMNGDILTTLRFEDMLEFHRRNDAWGTLAVSKRRVNVDYGVIVADEADRMVEYVEKPTIPYEVSMGINVLSRGCLDYIPATGKFDMPQLMVAMQSAGRPVCCYRTDCYWQDIGRFDDYQQASADFVASPERFLGQASR